MIHFYNQSGATFYLTLQESRENVTGLTSAYTFLFTCDSNGYSAKTNIDCTNYSDTGHTEIRYNKFIYDVDFDFNGFYTYKVYDPSNAELLEIGRLKVHSGQTSKTSYKEVKSKKQIYKK